MKFLIDAQLPPGLTHWLIDRGFEAQHVEEIGLHDADDSDIWVRALADNSIIITKDEDFVERVAHSKNSPRIVWLRIGNTTNAALKQWLTKRFTNIEELLNRGDAIIEVR